MAYTIEIPLAGPAPTPIGRHRRTIRVRLLKRGSGKVRVRLSLTFGAVEYAFGQSRWMPEAEWRYSLEPELSGIARAANMGFVVMPDAAAP